MLYDKHISFRLFMHKQTRINKQCSQHLNTACLTDPREPMTYIFVSCGTIELSTRTITVFVCEAGMNFFLWSLNSFNVNKPKMNSVCHIKLLYFFRRPINRLIHSHGFIFDRFISVLRIICIILKNLHLFSKGKHKFYVFGATIWVHNFNY